MNLVFFLLIILIGIAFWASFAFAFVPIGEFLYRLWFNTQSAMSEESEEGCDDIEKF